MCSDATLDALPRYNRVPRLAEESTMLRKLTILLSAALALAGPVSAAEQAHGNGGGGHAGGGHSGGGGGASHGSSVSSAGRGPSVSGRTAGVSKQQTGGGASVQRGPSISRERAPVYSRGAIPERSFNRVNSHRGYGGEGRGGGHYSHRRHHWHGRWWDYGVGSCWAYSARYDEYYWDCDDDD